jgi:uncharacterized protein YhaN
MRLLSFHVDGFGILHDTGIDPLPPGLCIILGDNGAGKSTLLEFMRALLFGFRDGRSRLPRYEPLRGGQHGGRALVELADGHRYRIARVGGSGTGQETVMAISDDAPNRDLSSLLGGATRDLFENVFAFSLSELQDISTLDKEALTARLYAAGAGTGALSLPTVRDALDKEARALYSRAASARLIVLGNEIKALRERQAKLSDTAERYAQLQIQREQLMDELREADRAEAAAAAHLEEQKALQAAWPDWTELQLARQAVADFGEIPPVPEGAEERLKAVRQNLTQRMADAAAAEQRLQRSDADLAGACARLGEGWDERRLADFDAGPSTEQAIRTQATALSDRAREVAAAEASVAHAEEALRQAMVGREALEAEEAQRWPKPPRTMDSIETDLGTLREARATATRLAEERAGRNTLEARRQGAEEDLKRLRVAPEPVAQPAHIPLMLAFGLLAASAALVSFNLMASAALFVLFLIVAAIAIRTQRRARSIVRAQRQEEIRDAEGRLKDVEDKLAAADEAIAKQLTALQGLGAQLGLKNLSELAELDPVEQRLMAERDSARAFAEFGERLRSARKAEARAADARDEARASASSATAALSETEKRWKIWLEERGIPTALKPDGALQFVEQVRAARKLIEERDRRRLELKEAQGRVASARDVVAAMIAASGDADEEAFLKHAAAWRSLQEARRRVEALRGRLEARAPGDRFTQLETALAGSDAESLARSVDAATKQHAEARTRAQTLRTRDGEMAEQMRTLESSREIEEVGRALADKISLAEEAFAEWAVRRLCLFLLDEARLKFERERQPAVIRHAGERLNKVTNGTYTRLMRPMGKDEIQAEHASGELRGRNAWNRGLLEQIYLCLRLGFIEDYCASTEPLPIVMDDVFANFDPDHARRSAEALAAFAESHQIVYMTCHPETVGFFRACGTPASAFYILRDGQLEPADK